MGCAGSGILVELTPIRPAFTSIINEYLEQDQQLKHSHTLSQLEAIIRWMDIFYLIVFTNRTVNILFTTNYHFRDNTVEFHIFLSLSLALNELDISGNKSYFILISAIYL